MIINVMFFSLTSDKYDNVSDATGSSFIQQKELNQFQRDNLEEELYETIKHPCAGLVNYYITLIIIYIFSKDF